MAAQTMGASPWLSQSQPPVQTIEEAGAGVQPGMGIPDNCASNQPGADSDPSASGPLSPLTNLEPLRNALPEVPGSE